jgi:hypothetical protein
MDMMTTFERWLGLKLTQHQRRILVAMLALEVQHDCRWWSAWEIRHVVESGVQKRSMAALVRLGLIKTEYSSWPPEVRRAVRCTCAQHHWGLTSDGRTIAEETKTHLSAYTQNMILGTRPGMWK